jgi:hypothetical protein
MSGDSFENGYSSTVIADLTNAPFTIGVGCWALHTTGFRRGSAIMINESSSPGLHWEAMAPRTRQTFEELVSIPISNDFYLAGGTALALQIGHRNFRNFFNYHLKNITIGQTSAYIWLMRFVILTTPKLIHGS